MYKYIIFIFMNVIYIIYLVNNKVGLVIHLLPFKFEVMGSIPKNNTQANI